MIQIKVSLLHPFTGDEMMYIKRNIKDMRDPEHDIVLLMWKGLLNQCKQIRTFLRRVAGGRIKTEIFDRGNRKEICSDRGVWIDGVLNVCRIY